MSTNTHKKNSKDAPHQQCPHGRGAPELLVAAASAGRRRAGLAFANSSSSSSPSSPPSSPQRQPAAEPSDPSPSAAIERTARELHPTLVSLINSGFIESRRRLREELAEDAWSGGGGGGEEGGGGPASDNTTTLSPPAPRRPLPHTAPPSWAARRGIARFERFLAGGGDGQPPPWPEVPEEGERLEQAIAGMYAALDLEKEEEEQGEDGLASNGSGNTEHQQHPPAVGGAASAALRAVDAAASNLPTPRHRALARGFLQLSVSEALRDEYERAAKESAQMADLGSGGGVGGGGAGGVSKAAGGVALGFIKRVLPLGWLGWLVPGMGRKEGGGGGGGGGGDK